MSYVIIVLILAAVAIGFLLSMGVVAAIIGVALKNNAEAKDPDSELNAYNY